MDRNQTFKKLEKIVTDFRKHAFLVDFDGTLVDLVPNPANICVPEETIQNLSILSQTKECAFAIVTGRSLKQLDNFLYGKTITTIACHGAECRLNGIAGVQYLSPPIPSYVCDSVHDVSDCHSCFFEDKTYSIALHLPFTHSQDDIKADILASLGKHQADYFIRKVGRTYEIMRQGITKGSGIRHLMTQPSFLGRRPVYIGDDALIDESLNVITEMNGLLFPVRHIHHTAPKTNGEELKTKDVRALVASLCQVTSRNKM